MKVTMKKSLLTSLVLGLSVLSAPMATHATLPTAVNGQALPSLAPMLEKVRPAVVSIAIEGKTLKHQHQDVQFQKNLSSSLVQICLEMADLLVSLKAKARV